MRVERDGAKVSLPDFIIVGAAKSATTTLYHYLKQHRQVYMPAIKEPWFFCFRNELPLLAQHNHPAGVSTTGVHVFKDDDYFQLFDKAKEWQISGEASTAYLYFAERTIRHMKEIYGEKFRTVKIIMVLRDPVARAWSHYMMHVRDGIAGCGFMEAIEPEVVNGRMERGWSIAYDYVGQGMYSERVAAFLREFDCVRVILFEELVANPSKIMKELLEFLSIDTDETPINISRKYNASGVPAAGLKGALGHLLYKENWLRQVIKLVIPIKMRSVIKNALSERLLEKREIPHEIERHLQNRFREDVERLEKLLGKEIAGWK